MSSLPFSSNTLIGTNKSAWSCFIIDSAQISASFPHIKACSAPIYFPTSVVAPFLLASATVFLPATGAVRQEREQEGPRSKIMPRSVGLDVCLAVGIRFNLASLCVGRWMRNGWWMEGVQLQHDLLFASHWIPAQIAYPIPSTWTKCIVSSQ
jgi:hypothetical protein